MGRKLSHIYTPYSIIFFTILALPSFCSEETNTANEIVSSPITPLKVVDGDSLEIGPHRIRLIGIDAPEYHQKCKNKQQKTYPCGKESLHYLQNLIANNIVRCKIHQKDKYNRDLCTCYSNNTNINAEMVRSGHAITYLDNSYTNEQQEAKVQKRGIWNGKFMHPRLFRRLQEEQKRK
ncbi:MAG: thermonuclease family protein [Acetobacter sp.]|nr:thermonuclease family protein [Acetobacter sp.]